MASTKSVGSTKNGRDSASKRLGVKKNNGQFVSVGEIIIRQRGSRYLHGINVRKGADDTLYAGVSGIICFTTTTKTRFDHALRRATIVSIVPRV